MLCDVLGLPRSSIYYEPRPDEDRPLREALIEVAGQWPTYGYRRLTKQLKREGHIVNSKLRAQADARAGNHGESPGKEASNDGQRPRVPAILRTSSRSLEVTRPERGLGGGYHLHQIEEGVRVFGGVDGRVHSLHPRLAPGSRAGPGVDAGGLEAGLRAGRCPEIHHSDQGVQYAATAYVELLTDREVKVSMASVGEPEENGYAERLMRTIKEEEVDSSEYEDFGDARGSLGRFLDDVYNRKRIHSSLGYLTPSRIREPMVA